MATFADVARIALALPETTEGKSYGLRAWKVAGKTYVWERPLRKADVKALGTAAPMGDVLGIHTESLEMKEAMLASGERAFFTTPHFDGYGAVLVLIAELSTAKLRLTMEDAWLARAPAKLAERYLADKPVKRAARR